MWLLVDDVVVSDRQHKAQLNAVKETLHKTAEEQRKKEVETLKREHEAVLFKREQELQNELEAMKKEMEVLRVELEKESKRALNPTFAPEASVEIRTLREELDKAQELFEVERKQIHAKCVMRGFFFFCFFIHQFFSPPRYQEEREIELKHQAFREEQHRVLKEENMRLEERFEQMEEKAKQLERAKADFERKTAELEAAKNKAGAEVTQRVAAERKKIEAEFAMKLQQSGVAQLSAECEKLKKNIAQLKGVFVSCLVILFSHRSSFLLLLLLSAELEAARNEAGTLRVHLSQEKAAAHETEQGLRRQIETIRAEMTAREKKSAESADVLYLKNTMLKFMQSEQKEV